MYHSENLVAKTQHLLPDLDLLEDHLREDPETIISRAFPPVSTRCELVELKVVSCARCVKGQSSTSFTLAPSENDGELWSQPGAR